MESVPELVVTRNDLNLTVNCKNISRIDFTNDNWFEVFLQIRENKANSYFSNSHVNDTLVEQLLKNDTGFSVAYATPSNAIISNVCILNSTFIYFHEPEANSLYKDLYKYYHIQCIYLNYWYNFKSLQSPLKDGLRKYTMYVTLRFQPNIYHGLEGLSSLIRLAAHPEEFPRIKQVFINMQYNYPSDSWVYTLKELIFSLFHESLRPTIIHDDSFCEKALVFGGHWTPYGYGSFIPEPLIADMLRAAAYKYVGWHYKQPEDRKLSAFLLQRGGRRRIINSDELYKRMIYHYKSSLHIDYFSLDNVTAKEQIRLFASLDVAVHPHGAGSTNMIFMLPNSCMLEIFPPKFFIDYYRMLSIGLEIRYDYVISQGDLPEFCIDNNLRRNCPMEYFRDREYVASIKDIIVKLDVLIPFVQKNKYPLLWS